MDERRKHVRIATDAPASIAVGKAVAVRGRIANFSERGIFIKADIRPALGQPVHLNFILRPDHDVVEASGKVAWIAPHGVGVFFDEVNDAFNAFVDELSTAHKSTTEAPKRALVERILGDADIEIS